MPALFKGKPNGNYSMLERLEWLTDVRTGRDGTEQRTAVRSVPRYRFEWVVSAVPDTDNWTALQALRGSVSHYIPLWPHAVGPTETWGAGMPTRGYIAGWAYAILNPDRSMGTASGITTRPDDVEAVIPLAEATLEDSRQIEHITDEFAQYRVAWLLKPHFETMTMPGWSLDYADRIIAPFGSGEWSASVEENIDLSQNILDTGTNWYEDFRHSKRQVSVSLVLNGGAVIDTLRQFLFAVKGRFTEFAWQPHTDAVRSGWRLASDAIEIEYITPTLARTRLNLIQVSDD